MLDDCSTMSSLSALFFLLSQIQLPSQREGRGRERKKETEGEHEEEKKEEEEGGGWGGGWKMGEERLKWWGLRFGAVVI